MFTTNVPYDKYFQRTKAHYSNLYWGASLAALYHLGNSINYAFIGCNSNGNNAYFIRRDKLGRLKELTLAEGYVKAKYRESRDKKGKLTYITRQKRLEMIKGLPVFNIVTNQDEIF